MLNDQSPKWGTKAWFELQFSEAFETGEDFWGHQWKAGEKYRYFISLNLIKDNILKMNNQKILDLGCGLGNFTNMIFQLNKKNKIFGMDISESAIKVAKIEYPSINFSTTTLPTIQSNMTFDGIIALESIYYLNHEARRKTFKNISKRLKTGGWFLFSTLLSDDPRYFTEKNAIEMIKESGFKIEKIAYIHDKPYTAFTKPLSCLIKRNYAVNKMGFFGFFCFLFKQILMQLWLFKIFEKMGKFLNKKSHLILYVKHK